MTDNDTPLPIPATTPQFRFDLERLHEEVTLDTIETAAEFGRITGKKAPHIGAVRRMFQTGSRGVVLPSLLIGGRRLTTASAIRWWIMATTQAAASGYGPRQPKTPEAPQPMTAHERQVLARNGVV